MKSVKRTIKRLNDIEEAIDEASFLLDKACGEMELVIRDVESDLDFVELMESGRLRGGKNSILEATHAIEEVKENAQFKISQLEEKRLLLIMALESYRKILG